MPSEKKSRAAAEDKKAAALRTVVDMPRL